MWYAPGPLSDGWQIPAGSGHRFLLKYLIAQQVNAYGTHIIAPPFTRAILTRNMKLLCIKYPEDSIKRAIALGCLTSEYPFSTKYIEEQLRWLEGSRNSPIQQFYQNKS